MAGPHFIAWVVGSIRKTIHLGQPSQLFCLTPPRAGNLMPCVMTSALNKFRYVIHGWLGYSARAVELNRWHYVMLDDQQWQQQ